MVGTKYACPAPFTHMYVTATEGPGLCCVARRQKSESPTDNENLEEVWQSESYTSARTAMLADMPVKECSTCYDKEAAGDASDRQMHIRSNRNSDIKVNVNSGNEFGSPLNLDLRPSNLCNLACRMCNTNNSSQLVKEIKSFPYLERYVGVSPTVVPFLTEKNIEFLLRNVANRENPHSKIKILGGEPSIMPEVHILLDQIINTPVYDQTKIFFTTNFTNTNSTFKNKISKIKNLQLAASMDGVGDTIEYIRHPIKWDTIKKNIISYATSNILKESIEIIYTLQAYNLSNLLDTIKWVNSVNIEYSLKIPIKLTINTLHSPTYFSCGVLPKEYREKLITEILESDDLATYYNITSRTEVNDIILGLNVILNSPSLGAYWVSEFAKATRNFDKARNQHIKDYIPELWPIIEPYYNH